MIRISATAALLTVSCSAPQHEVEGRLVVVNESPHTVEGYLKLRENNMDDHCSCYCTYYA